MHFPPPVNGAAVMGQYIKESRMISDQFETQFINLSTSSRLNDIGKKGFGKIGTSLSIMGRLIVALWKTKFDVCYISLTAKGTGFYKDLMMVAVVKAFNRKLIYHFHNKGVAQAGKNFINNLLYRFTFRNTSSILLSPRLYPDICEYVSPFSTYFCPNGIAPLNNQVQTETKESVAVTRILFV